MRKLAIAIAPILWMCGCASTDADQRSEREVLERFEEFNRAWERQDTAFIEGYYAHDPDMLLFFERRQLLGWQKVETLYKNMFANAREGTVKSTVSNVKVRARGDMAWLAANFRLEVQSPSGNVTVDEGRQSLVFERRDGQWRVAHRHTSFQAPAGPQRRVALHTEPGPLWDPTLEGAWRLENGNALLIASATHLVFQGAAGLPQSATYVLTRDSLTLKGPSGEMVVRRPTLTPARLTFEVGSANKPTTLTWNRIE